MEEASRLRAAQDDTGEAQLARTLFEVTGTLAQARYLAERVADPQLGRSLRRLIDTGEATEALLRRRVARALTAPAPVLAPAPRWAASKVATVTAIAASAVAATATGAAIAWRKLNRGALPGHAPALATT